MPPKRRPSMTVNNVKAGARTGKRGTKSKIFKKDRDSIETPILRLEDSIDPVEEKDLDFRTDLNDEFFARANKVKRKTFHSLNTAQFNFQIQMEINKKKTARKGSLCQLQYQSSD